MAIKSSAKMPSSKIALSRVCAKQLEHEIERLESMQPNALCAVRFHRYRGMRKKKVRKFNVEITFDDLFFVCVCVRGSFGVSDGRRVQPSVSHKLLTRADLFESCNVFVASWFARSTITNGAKHDTFKMVQTHTHNNS